MRILLSLFAASLLCAACASDQKKPANSGANTGSAATEKTKKPMADGAGLGEIKFSGSGGATVMTLGADGNLAMADGKASVTIAMMGKDIVAKSGETIKARLGEDGMVHGPDGKPMLPGKIRPDGVYDQQGQTISIGADGKVTASVGKFPQLTIVGADTPMKKRAAVFVVLMSFMVGKSEGTAPKASPAAK